MSFDTEHLHDIRIIAQVTCLSNCGLKKVLFFSFMAHQHYFTPFEPSQLAGKTKKKQEIPGNNPQA